MPLKNITFKNVQDLTCFVNHRALNPAQIQAIIKNDREKKLCLVYWDINKKPLRLQALLRKRSLSLSQKKQLAKQAYRLKANPYRKDFGEKSPFR